MVNIAIFASGNGTNAQCIAEHFAHSHSARVALIVSSRGSAPVVERAARLGICCEVIEGEQMQCQERVLNLLRSHGIGLIVLAGYLRCVPQYLVEAYPCAMLNLHPALLPKYGGRGMYGMHVHQAVIDGGECESGITIHYVNQRYDEGQIIAQWRCPVCPTDTAETLAQRIHQLEYEHYPEVIEQVAERLNTNNTEE